MGSGARNKGLALFPSKIDGEYVMLSRLDGENLFLMKSKEIRFWENPTLLKVPKFYWELVQVGNCGSPMETEHGWLLLTRQGWVPMRRFLHRGHAAGSERYLQSYRPDPRALAHPDSGRKFRIRSKRRLFLRRDDCVTLDLVVIPYAMSDRATSFATVELQPLLKAMKD